MCLTDIVFRSGPEVPKEVAVSTEVSSLGPRGSAPFTVASSMLLLHTQVSLNSQQSWRIHSPRDTYFDTGFVKLKRCNDHFDTGFVKLKRCNDHFDTGFVKLKRYNDHFDTGFVKLKRCNDHFDTGFVKLKDVMTILTRDL